MTFDSATTSTNGVDNSVHLEIKPILSDFKTEIATQPQLTQLMPATVSANDFHSAQQQQMHQNYSQHDFCQQSQLQQPQHQQQLMVAVASLHHQQQLAAIAMAAASSATSNCELTSNLSNNDGTNNRGRNSSALMAAQQLAYENCPICGDRVSGKKIF